MKRFSQLLDRLTFSPQRHEKVKLITDYLKDTPDPDRGYGLGILTGVLDFPNARPSLLRHLVGERVDPVLFGWSYDFVGDLAETIALIWPAPLSEAAPPRLAGLVGLLHGTAKQDMPATLAGLLDRLDAEGRWALIKMLTGGLRVGVSARLAKQAVAALGGLRVEDIEEVWHGLAPPFLPLFAWAEGGRPPRLDATPAPFRPVMLAHALDEADLATLDAENFLAEWKWDGIRVQAASQGGAQRLYSRTGEDISPAFPDLLEDLPPEAVIDGELLVMRGDEVRPFAELQQRLNRKAALKGHLLRHPAHLMAYDLLWEEGRDLRDLPLTERRVALEARLARHTGTRLRLSPLLPFASWDALARLRAAPPSPAIEGIMLKARRSAYLAGRIKGHWFKWKRAPYLIDAVLLYAQRGHGKRSSFYSDYTFGVWSGETLVPVGKAYFGFTDAELQRIDHFVRANTVNRFGPVREVIHEPARGLVLEVAFEGLQRSPRHKSGIAMRFPRISRLRWDKPPVEADRLETLERLLATPSEAPSTPR